MFCQKKNRHTIRIGTLVIPLPFNGTNYAYLNLFMRAFLKSLNEKICLSDSLCGIWIKKKKKKSEEALSLWNSNQLIRIES